MPLIEINFDGVIGPSHNYVALSPGKLASTLHAGNVAYPRAAALPGLEKMRTNIELGPKIGRANFGTPDTNSHTSDTSFPYHTLVLTISLPSSNTKAESPSVESQVRHEPEMERDSHRYQLPWCDRPKPQLCRPQSRQSGVQTGRRQCRLSSRSSVARARENAC